MTTPTWGRLAPMLVVPVLALGLAGCSGDDEKKAEGEKPTVTETPSQTPMAQTTSPADLPEEPKINNKVGAVADVTWDVSKCGTAAGEQKVEGTLTNPTKERFGYVVIINWTDASSNVLGRGVAVVRGARPDEETPWELTGEVVDGAVQCVITAYRGDLPK